MSDEEVLFEYEVAVFVRSKNEETAPIIVNKFTDFEEGLVHYKNCKESLLQLINEDSDWFIYFSRHKHTNLKEGVWMDTYTVDLNSEMHFTNDTKITINTCNELEVVELDIEVEEDDGKLHSSSKKRKRRRIQECAD